MKIISARKNGVNTEFANKTLKQVLELVEQDSELYLERHDKGVIGHAFIAEAYIGNSSNVLTRGDYYNAYDNIF